MPVLPIRQVPDPVLRVACDHVTVFDAALVTLTDDMFATMYAAPGRGLAAPQVGITKRLFVMDTDWKTGTPAPMVFVNPVVTAVSETLVTQPEGCLSIPGDLSDVSRPDAITLQWQDVQGQVQNAAFDGFAAACVQHEIDHLDGILITDAIRKTI